MGRSAQPMPVIALARRIGLGRNCLRRPIDRVEALLVVVMWLMTAVVAFGGVVLGLSITERDFAVATQQMTALHPVSASLLDDTLAGVGGTATQVSVPVQWTDSAGARHSGRTNEAVGQRAGSKVTVWLDSHGALAGPPMGPEDAVAGGIAGGMAAALGAQGLLLAIYMVARWRMTQVKAVALAAEWEWADARWKQGRY